MAEMSKITLASSAEVWLINLPGEPFNHFYSNDMEGLGLTGIQEVFLTSLENMRNESRVIVEGTDQDMDTLIIMAYNPELSNHTTTRKKHSTTSPPAK